MSRLARRLQRRLEAEGLNLTPFVIQRTRAGPRQRAAGAWSFELLPVTGSRLTVNGRPRRVGSEWPASAVASAKRLSHAITPHNDLILYVEDPAVELPDMEYKPMVGLCEVCGFTAASRNVRGICYTCDDSTPVRVCYWCSWDQPVVTCSDGCAERKAANGCTFCQAMISTVDTAHCTRCAESILINVCRTCEATLPRSSATGYQVPDCTACREPNS